MYRSINSLLRVIFLNQESILDFFQMFFLCHKQCWVFKKLINLFIYFLAVLGLHCFAFSSCGEQGLLFVAVCRLLSAVASLVAEHGL